MPAMGSRERLLVRVNDELVLDAGQCEEVVAPLMLVTPYRWTLTEVSREVRLRS